jgi:DNA excision repair protein ERCC-2
MDIFFPHEQVRQYQDDFIRDIHKAVFKKEHLIAHAPTGIGKSAAVLSATIKLAIEKNLTIFFVTPRHTQHKIVIDTLSKIKTKFNLNFTVVDLIGKKSFCALDNIESLSSSEFNEYCKYAVSNDQCQFYLNTIDKKQLTVKAKKVLNELNGKCFHAEELKNIALQNSLCPYEISCLVSKSAKVIVADYNHILNPFIRENLLKKMNKEITDLILIIDEAHNVVQKTRDLLSAKLTTINLERAKKEALFFGSRELAEILEQLSISISDTVGYENERLITKQEILNFIEPLIDYSELINKLTNLADKTHELKKRSYASSVANFLILWLGPDDVYTRIIGRNYTQQGSKQSYILYQCLDPSVIVKPLSNSVHSMILMSGTLMPIDVYKNLFGIDAETRIYRSPFPINNKLTVIVPETTTKFTVRSDDMYKRIAKKCVEITEAIPGNSFIFFPSYDIRNKVYNYFIDSSRTIFLEDSKMKKQDRDELLKKFSSYKDSGAVLLAVTSGSFGEGIDMPGDLLKGVIIVGLPLSKPDLETKELINYYDKKYGNGLDYGYVLPAFVKCFQNAGRCIRSETDRGVIIYLDERYTWSNYFKFFSQTEYLRVVKNPTERIKEFFNL